MNSAHPQIELRRWADDDIGVLFNTVGDRAMMVHLGGPEDSARICARHARYLDLSGPGCMFTIRLEGSTVAGTIGFWETAWRGECVYETGWMVLPEFSGRGIASAAARQIVARAKEEGRRRFLHAYPSVENAASNAVCAKAGFVKLGECTVEYPKGHLMKSNDWRIDLRAPVIVPEL